MDCQDILSQYIEHLNHGMKKQANEYGCYAQYQQSQEWNKNIIITWSQFLNN